MKSTETYTVITGASMGLGKEMAIECARRGKNLILVALPGRNLKQLCGELELEFGIKAECKECDLTDEHELEVLCSQIISEYSIDQLINNAGVGGAARFDEASVESLDRIIHLNIRATTILTRFLLPELKSHPRALIMNVASVAAFGALPYKTIYPASKAFIYSFSRSLSKELRKTSVKVVVIAPGPMITNPDVALRIIKQGALCRIGLLTAGQVSRLAISGAELGKEVIVPGIMNRLNRFLIRWTPEALRLSIMERVLRKELTDNIHK